MEKNKIDQTKENIGVSKLDEQTRKDLFEKFVDRGGKVIDEKTLRRKYAADIQKKRPFVRRVDVIDREYKKKITKEKIRATSAKEPAVLKPVQPGERGELVQFFSMIKLKLKLGLLGITGLNGYYFNNRFFRKFNNQYKPALIELQILFLEIFRRDPSVGRTITSKLDEMKPLYYELVEMVGNLFDKIVADQIIEQYINFPDVPKKTLELKQQILQFYKKMYILNPFENVIQTAFERAIDIYLKEEKNVSDSTFSMKRRMRNAVFIVFNKFYPRLHLLFCLYQGRTLDLFDPDIEELLGVTEAEKPGNRQLAKYFDDMAASLDAVEIQQPPEEPEEVEEDRMKFIRMGLEEMAKLDIADMRKKYDQQHLFENVSSADKVLMAYLLFNEFDREYSFILTTNKIKIRTDFVARTKIDYRARLVELYDKMRKSSDSLKEYAEELVNYEKSRREKPASSSQYIEFTKRMESLEKKKNTVGKNALAVIREYMLEVSQELKVLMEDMDSHQLYIANPQEMIAFDPLIEGEKKINGKRIYEAVAIVYSYALAFAYRLSQEGDLSGNLEFRKEELDKMQGQLKSGEAASPDKKEKEKDKSPLEELDDMI
jgi:hypothetical protein